MPEVIDPRTHRVLAGASRVRVLEFLRDSGTPLSAPEVAEQVRLHPNTVRLHLDQLADAGLVTREREARTEPGRPRLLYRATAAAAPHAAPPEDGAGEQGYRTLASLLAGRLEQAGGDPAEEAAGAGRSWARTLAAGAGPRPLTPAEATDRVVRTLDELGFAPAVPVPGGPVELHRCPFFQVARQHSRVVCGVHLGLMQGLLEDLGAPVRATRLEPFVTPALCLAHLTPLPAGAGGAGRPDRDGAAPPPEGTVP